jgi:hypothetical protein
VCVSPPFNLSFSLSFCLSPSRMARWRAEEPWLSVASMSEVLVCVVFGF